MPMYKLCAYAGCFRPVPIGEKYCPQHKVKGLESEKRQKALNEQRRRRNTGSSSAKGYGRKWQQLRNRFIKQHPHCAECMRQGRITLATDVDHIVPHNGDPRLLYDENNLQSLCKSCHSRKTAREDGAFGNKKLIRI